MTSRRRVPVALLVVLAGIGLLAALAVVLSGGGGSRAPAPDSEVTVRGRGLERFAGATPDPAVLSRRWHVMLDEAQRIIARLPADAAGNAVLTGSGELCRAAVDELNDLVQQHAIRFHGGRIRGALPTVQA